jgi:hypothetical protein
MSIFVAPKNNRRKEDLSPRLLPPLLRMLPRKMKETHVSLSKKTKDLSFTHVSLSLSLSLSQRLFSLSYISLPQRLFSLSYISLPQRLFSLSCILHYVHTNLWRLEANRNYIFLIHI